MSARIAPASAPFDKDVAELIERTMQGRPPLHLFATLARDSRLCNKFFAGGLLDKGNLTIRQREIVINRTTALCRSEYEWGVHVAMFAEQAGLTAEQIRSTASGTAEDSCWSKQDRLLIRLCDALHRDCDIDEELWHDKLAGAPKAAAAGVRFLSPLGTLVADGDPLLEIHAQSPGELAYALEFAQCQHSLVTLQRP